MLGWFPSPVPQNGLTNLGAANFEAGNSDLMSRADGPEFAFQDFTIEAFVSLESYVVLPTSNSFRTIAGQYNTSGTEAGRGWRIGVTSEAGHPSGSNELILQLSTNGTSATVFTFDSNWAPSVTGDTNATPLYYIAAAVDLETTGQSTGTFYIMNLSDPTPVLQTIVTNLTLTAPMFNTTTDFRVGASWSGTAVNTPWDGKIDELRLSNTTLSPQELLISVPEPSSALALMGLAAPLLASRRGRRA